MNYTLPIVPKISSMDKLWNLIYSYMFGKEDARMIIKT